MTDRTVVEAPAHPSTWPWAVVAATAVILAASAWLDATATGDGFEPEAAVFGGALAAFSVVGALIVSRIPRHRIGLLFLVMGLAGSLSVLTDLSVVAEPPLPGRGWLAIANHIAGPLSVAAIAITLLRFPDGELLSPAWRWVERLVFLSIGVLVIGGSLMPTFEDYPGVENPLGIDGAGAFLESLAGVGWLCFLPTVLLAGVSQILRFRRARGEERRRLKWFALAAFFLVIGWVCLALSFDGTSDDVASRLLALPYSIALVTFPILCGIAILRHRLFDIDVAIRRTVVSGALALFIAGVYVAIVVGIGELVGGGDGSNVALQVAATAVIAVAFEPVRARITRFANRLVYGERATPYEVMATLSRRVAGTVSVEDVLPEMARAATSGIAATTGRVRLVLPRGERVVSWPPEASEDRAPDHAVDVRYGGDAIGEIAVWKPHGEVVTPSERELVDDLAAQAGLALHNVRLTEELSMRADDLAVQARDLRRSRERLVTARDVQRRRLEQDIREGPHRQLAAIGAELRVATATLDRDPEAAAAALDELGARATSTLEGLRDLARGIFPPLLADEGVVAALEAHVRKVGANADLRVDPLTRGARFDAEIEATVYFCCLQALQNVVRHAGNAPATVTISSGNGSVDFTVEDRGPGFAIERVPRGMGIQIMQDRVDALGGTLEIAPGAEGGTRVAGRIPTNAAT